MGPLRNLIVYPTRHSPAPQAALGSAATQAANAQPSMLALTAPEASAPAERSPAPTASAVSVEDLEDSQAPNPCGRMPALTAEDLSGNQASAKECVKEEAEDEVAAKTQEEKPAALREAMTGALRETKEAQRERAKNAGPAKAKAEPKAKAAGKAKPKAKAKTMKRPAAAHGASPRAEAQARKAVKRTASVSVDIAQQTGETEEPGAAHMACGAGNFVFHSAVYGHCKGEFYKAKSYLRYWDASNKKFSKMIIGSQSTKHEELCRRLVPLVRAGHSRQELVRQRDAWDV